MAAVNKSPLAQIDAGIKNLRKSGAKLRVTAHALLLQVLDHYAAHGDYTRLITLSEAVAEVFSTSIRKAMNEWIAQSVPSLEWDKDLSAFSHKKGASDRKIVEKVVFKSRDGKNAFEGNPRDFPFFQLEVITNPAPFDFDKAFIMLIKRAETAYEKSVKEGHTDGDLAAKIAVIKSLNVEDIHAEKEESVQPAELVKPERRRKAA